MTFAIAAPRFWIKHGDIGHPGTLFRSNIKNFFGVPSHESEKRCSGRPRVPALVRNSEFARHCSRTEEK